MNGMIFSMNIKNLRDVLNVMLKEHPAAVTTNSISSVLGITFEEAHSRLMMLLIDDLIDRNTAITPEKVHDIWSLTNKGRMIAEDVTDG